MLQVVKLSKAFAGQVIFEEVTWKLSDKDRVGLTGPNGSGKTTLLRMFAGLDMPDAGNVSRQRRSTIGYLPQEGLLHSGRTLREEALTAFEDVLALEEEQRKLEVEMSQLEPDSTEHKSVLSRYGECQEEWQRRGGFSLEARAEGVLNGLGFQTKEFDRPTETFSGGWQMRIALAKLLLSRPDALLLDEPTNHLDLEARNWLEDYLEVYPSALAMVSHDRYFLDRIVTRITEIDRYRLVDYSGNYTKYLIAREKQLEEQRARSRRQQEEIERTKRFISRFRYKASKARQVQSRVKMLEKMKIIELPPEIDRVRLRLPEVVRSGRVVVEMKMINKRYDECTVFEGADLIIERGDRLALVGPNGAGKSTLSRLLAGTEPPDSGERKLGHNVQVGYFSQERYDLDSDKTVLENMTEAARSEIVPQLRNILGAFLFHGDAVDKKVKVLSGGEKSRVALARMFLQPANILVLDEPTNHLDLESKDILLDALKAYQGTLVFVSHDRYFLDELATRVAEVGGGKIRLYWGNYEDYLLSKEKETQLLVEVEEKSLRGDRFLQPMGLQSMSKNQDRELRQRLEELEASIGEVETALDSLEGRMAVPGFYSDVDNSAQIVATHQTLQEKLKTLYGEWEELADTTRK